MLVDVVPAHVEGWAEEPASLTAGLGYLFARPVPREVFADLIEGLLSDLGRKNGWTMAERAGHATHEPAYHLQQHHWRALHQPRATVSHYNRRGDPLPARLRPWRPPPDHNRSHHEDLRL
jgi:hypothetical protein